VTKKRYKRCKGSGKAVNIDQKRRTGQAKGGNGFNELHFEGTGASAREEKKSTSSDGERRAGAFAEADDRKPHTLTPNF